MKRLIEYINAHALAVVAILSLAMIVGLLSGMTMAHGKTAASIPGQVADEDPFWDPDFYDGNIDLHPYFAMIDDLLKIIRQDSPVKDWILRIRR